jgi:hypothetical protein
MEAKDAEGKIFIKEAIANFKKNGRAIQNYKWMVTKTNKVEDRTIIVEAVDCGSKKVDVGITYEGKL